MRLSLTTFLTTLLLATGCTEQGPYPDREIRLIVHAAPGGISDGVSRWIGSALNDSLGVPVVVENRPGASGSIAFSFVKASSPDGYTLGYAPVDLAIVKHLGYSDIEPSDFDLLRMHTRTPAVLAVGADADYTTLDDFLGTADVLSLSIGTSGVGSIWDFAAKELARSADVAFKIVPFDGSGPAVAALMGDHVAAVIAGPAEVLPGVRSGRFKVLGVMSPTRSQVLPEAPTFSELGHALDVSAWGGFMVPKGVPDDRRAVLTGALESIIGSQAFRKYCEDRGLDAPGEGSFQAFAESEFQRFGSLVQ